MWAYVGMEKMGSLESEWVVRGLWVGSYGGGGRSSWRRGSAWFGAVCRVFGGGSSWGLVLVGRLEVWVV